jgi:monofunctional biosynthetic peptidoglycan transglycosylase
MALQSVSPTPFNPRGEILQKWVPLSRISCHLIQAVQASEDQKFETHSGFDISAIKAALRHNLKGNRVRGGSTITQQTAKNLFLWHRRSFVRKAFEAYFTFLIETIWSKRRIMEMYLNIIEMGNGIYGAEAAADVYFSKSAADLSREESALLAGILPSPKKRNPTRPSLRLKNKKDWILEQMARMPATTLCNSLK